MEIEELFCPVCLSNYNLKDRLPLVLPICAHTFCANCIQNLINQSNPAKCPFDRRNFLIRKTIKELSVNPEVKLLIEQDKKQRFCALHKQKAKYVCLTENRRVCRSCIKEETNIGHQVKHIDEIKAEAINRGQVLEQVLRSYAIEEERVKRLLDDEKEALIREVVGEFDLIRETLKQKESVIIAQINDYIKSKKGRLSSELGSDEQMKRSIHERIASLQNAKVDKMFIDKLYQGLPLFAVDIDHMNWKICANSFERKNCLKELKVLRESLVEQVQRPILPSFNFADNMDRCSVKRHNDERSLLIKRFISMRKEGNKLTIVPEDPGRDVEVPIDRLKEVKHIMLDFSKCSNDRQKIVVEETLQLLNCLWSQFGEALALKLQLGTDAESNHCLTNIITSSFWYNKKIVRFELIFVSKNDSAFVQRPQISDQNLFRFFCETLPQIEGLKEFHCKLDGIQVTDKTIEGFVNHNFSMIYNLECLEMSLNNTLVTDQSILQLLMPLNDSRIFKLSLEDTKVTDRVVETLARNNVPKMKNLESLELMLRGTAVTDLKAVDLFAGIRLIKKFVLLLNGAWITDQKAVRAPIKSFFKQLIGK